MLLLDTGIILAADTNDRAHNACVELLKTTTETLVTSPLVVAEASYLIDRHGRRHFHAVRPQHCDAFELLP